MYIDDIKVFAKYEKRTGGHNINNKKIQQGYKNGKFHSYILAVFSYCLYYDLQFFLKKCAKLIMEIGQLETLEKTELSNQESIRTLGEKEII